jgi:amidase
VFNQALEVLKAQGAVLVDVEKPKDHEAMGQDELVVLLTELKVDLAAYLASAAPAVKVKTLADVIAFNKGNARELGLFGQSLFEAAEHSQGLKDPEYLAALARSRQLAGPQGIEAMLAAAKAVALVAPTDGPAPIIDVVGRNEGGGIGAGNYAAIAGTPHLTVPMGAVHGLPLGLSFMGPKWSEAQLLALGYAYEQAAGIKLKPGFPAAIESIEPAAALLARPQ